MSLYNVMNKVNPATFFILPMLAEKHAEDYPRFRDCFVQKTGFKLIDGMPVMQPQIKDEKNEKIYVFTRTGGGNRSSFKEEIKEMQGHPNYITDYDDPFDNTYAMFEFSVPEEFKADYDRMVTEGPEKVSKTLQKRIRKVYPKLSETFDAMWGEDKDEILYNEQIKKAALEVIEDQSNIEEVAKKYTLEVLDLEAYIECK